MIHTHEFGTFIYMHFRLGTNLLQIHGVSKRVSELWNEITQNKYWEKGEISNNLMRGKCSPTVAKTLCHINTNFAQDTANKSIRHMLTIFGWKGLYSNCRVDLGTIGGQSNFCLCQFGSYKPTTPDAGYNTDNHHIEQLRVFSPLLSSNFPLHKGISLPGVPRGEI